MIDIQLMMRGASFNIFDRTEPDVEPENCLYSREDVLGGIQTETAEMPGREIDFTKGVDDIHRIYETLNHRVFAPHKFEVMVRGMSDREFEAFKASL